MRRLSCLVSAPRWVALALALACAGPVLPARADPSPQDIAAARTLFEDARKLMKIGKFAEACPKLEEGVRLNPGIGMRFNLAECYENLGKTASAWALYLDVAASAKAKKEPDREKIARDRANKLAPRVPHVTVVVEAEVPGLEVTRDGSVVGKGQFGTAVSLDPGTYTFAAHAPDHDPWEQKVVVGPDGASVTVKIPRLTATAKPPPPPPPAPPPPPPTFSTQRKVALAVAAVGLVGVGLGSYFGLHAIGLARDSNDHCDGNLCDPTGYTLRTDARSAGTLSTVAFVVGALGVGGGVALWVLGAPRTEAKAGLIVAPGIALLGVGGRW